MIHEIQANYKSVENAINEIVKLDGELSAINSRFKVQPLSERECALDTYCELLNKRENLFEPLERFKARLLNVVEKLDSTKLGFWEDQMHKKNIKKMEKLLAEDHKRSGFFQADDVNDEEVDIKPMKLRGAK